jgi:hypothetical protein
MTTASADANAARSEKPISVASKRAHLGVESEAVSLTRTTYKLPAERLQAVAAFLTQNLSDEIEVRVKGEALIVTATAEDQTAIAHLVWLLLTRGTREPKPASTGSDSRPVNQSSLPRQVDAIEEYIARQN